MFGITNGEIQGSVATPAQRSPSVYGKLGLIEKTFAERKHVRLTGSVLTKKSSINGTLFARRPHRLQLPVCDGTRSSNPYSQRLLRPPEPRLYR